MLWASSEVSLNFCDPKIFTETIWAIYLSPPKIPYEQSYFCLFRELITPCFWLLIKLVGSLRGTAFSDSPQSAFLSFNSMPVVSNLSMAIYIPHSYYRLWAIQSVFNHITLPTLFLTAKWAQLSYFFLVGLDFHKSTLPTFIFSFIWSTRYVES